VREHWKGRPFNSHRLKFYRDEKDRCTGFEAFVQMLGIDRSGLRRNGDERTAIDCRVVDTPEGKKISLQDSDSAALPSHKPAFEFARGSQPLLNKEIAAGSCRNLDADRNEPI